MVDGPETKVVEVPPLNRPKLLGPGRMLCAFRNSWQGFRGAFKAEVAFRQELALAAVLLPLALWLGDTAVEKVLMIGSMLIVLIVELFNTCIESVVDRIGLERHELSGLAKDVGSAAVLLSFILLLATWGLLLFD